MRKGDKSRVYPDAKLFSMAPETLQASAAYEKSSINSGSLAVYCAVDRFFDKRISNAVAFPSLRTLAKRTGSSSETVSRHLKVLNDAGFLIRKYAAKIRGRGVLDSLGVISPCSSYGEACKKAFAFKAKTNVGATICLLIYKPKDGEPTARELVQKGYLPNENENLWEDTPEIIDRDVDNSAVAAPTKISALTPHIPQQNDNDVMTTTVKDNKQSDAAGHPLGSLVGHGPLNKYSIHGERLKELLELELEEDSRFLITDMRLRFLSEQRSVDRFESVRLRDKLWMLELPEIADINYCQVKLDYLGYKIPDEISVAIKLYPKSLLEKSLLVSAEDRPLIRDQLRALTGCEANGRLS